ncbi:MAG: O-antigen ligase family protein [Clostridium sp.]
MISKEKYLNYYIYYILLCMVSIFIVDYKVYIPLFAIAIIFSCFLLMKRYAKFELNKISKDILIFIIWAIINSIISISVYSFEINKEMILKLILNMLFLLSVCIVLSDKSININRKHIKNVLIFIIVINFMQIIYIYIVGNLFNEFLSGALTSSSTAAYTIGEFKNVIGAVNKNIWASKFTFIYIIYFYMVFKEGFRDKVDKVIIGIGLLVILLLLSRTAQIAIIPPIIYVVYFYLNKLNKKYKIPIYIVSVALLGMVGWIFFDKFFHIKFDMTDGGYTRLYIWVKSLKELVNNNVIIGNGIGYSDYFIGNILGRPESNVHNVFLGLSFELGLIGIVIYLKIWIDITREYILNKNIIAKLFILIIPILIILNLQYLGYDNDIVAVIILIILVMKSKKIKD